MSISPPSSPEGIEVPVFDAPAADDPQRVFDEATRDFEDEPPVRHNLVPDIDDEDSDEGHTMVAFEEGPVAALSVGQIFYDKEIIQRLVLNHGLCLGRNLRKYRHDTNKICFNCIGGDCEWKLYAAKSAHSSKWVIRQYNNEHKCLPNGKCKLLKVTEIAKLFVDKIREEPDYYMPKKIEAIIRERWNVTASRPQCQAGRRKALKWINEAYEEHFRRLRDYAAEILKWNPTSTVEVETISTEGVDIFSRFYICYEGLRNAWKDTCRRLICLDGCFMRSTMKGQLLVALGRDGNNQIYPIAWEVVQVENRRNWIWFLQKVKIDLDLEDGLGYCIISDRQKGLLKAVELELPKAEHRMCVRHIYANLKSIHGKKKEMKLLLWQLAWSYNTSEYKDKLHKLQLFNQAVYFDVLSAKPEQWCRAFQEIGSCCEDVNNNSIESFNASIVRPREKLVVPMLEGIATLAMIRICNRSIIAEEHPGRLTPYVVGVLVELHQAASECIVNRGTNNQHMVKHGAAQFRVCLSSRTCSCRKWDTRGIPCEHAYVVIISRSLAVEDYVAHWYRTDVWKKTYAEGIGPTRSIKFWPQVGGPLIQRPPSPPQPGRKKKQKRKKGVNESPSKRIEKVLKRTIHCGVCGTANHNSRFHKKGSNMSQGSQSQGDFTQSQEVPQMASQGE